ncbi:MAG: carboxypeptidase regulatory-like domain-containing protein [Hyphomicrobiales bacterium]|nr:carboxypeptidase regulatory-like domain-containing protein [Hyphomicrobiales bacterium]
MTTKYATKYATNYAMAIDVSRCIGCYNCVLACRDEHAGNDHLPVAVAQPEHGQRWIDVREQERGSFPRVHVSYVPVPCQQCADAPCIDGSGAVYRRNDGIVLIDPARAVGRRDIVSTCPYRAIFWNASLDVPQKCTFCAHLLDAGWKEPRCVEVCPTQALVFGDISAPESPISQLRATSALEELQPSLGLRPQVGYLGLPQRFLTGEVVLSDKPDIPAEGVGVSLRCDGRVSTTVTDNFGDFEFSGLAANATYLLSIEHPGYHAHKITVAEHGDLDVGTIALEPLAVPPAGRRERS